MRLFLFEGQSFEEPLELSSVDSEGLRCFVVGPFEASFFESFVVEPESVSIPSQNFDFVPLFVAEDEEVVVEEV